jgi:uridine phosphorylase
MSTPTDENRAVIDPKKGKREEALPSSAILIFTSQDLDLFIKCFTHPPRISHRIYLSNVYTGSYDGAPVALIGPVLGAPQAVLILEKIIALGVKEVMAVGWCGSLQPHVKVGDVVLPDGAISEEGTSSHYPISLAQPGPSLEMLSPLKDVLLAEQMKIHEGHVWTTDAPFRETVGKVLAYQKRGVLAVDMEASALFTVAHFRGIRMAMAMVVSDELSTLKWVHGFREPRFRESRERLIKNTLKVVCHAIRLMAP